LPESPAAASPSLIVVGIVAGVAADVDARKTEFSSTLSEEIQHLALQHPDHDLYGRGGVE
jgi:hypothetical protein